jgi:hypothetical protein
MDAKQRILEKADKLIQKGAAVLQTTEHPEPGNFSPSWVEDSAFAEWKVQALALLERVGGEAATYAKRFEAEVEQAYEHDTKCGLGILRAFREDVDDGALQRIADLVSAEVFDDFLSQADHLLSQSYAPAAASLAGAVLERDLRSRCAKRGIKVKSNDGISALNQKLVSAQPQEYSAVTSKKIEMWAKIRNEADHGHFESVEESDVRDMLSGIRNFAETHLP